MEKQNKPFERSEKLRQKAEILLNKMDERTDSFSFEADKLKLIHELKVHQIELEIQNEELKLAVEKEEIAKKKYIELYDFAPSGHLTLTNKGKIIDLNISAENLLKKTNIIN
ncbi:hypothetical protein [Maribellus maritimus]|uniref:hypothetical protein n=1 Tax=Maribellus maritimus TaxID=2870838 RepID=UPI001EEAEE93|nr:hypothetical protein [Maribellus maritimus]MCG6191280.1 hypothetical protein [Maribellus maritimus]